MCRKAKPELLTSGFFQLPKQSFVSAQTMVFRGSNNCHTIDELKNNKLMSGFGIPTARAQRFIALEWCTSVFFICWSPTADLWWRSLEGNKDRHSPTTGAPSAALTGSSATTALIRVRHLALRMALQRTGSQLGSVLKDALTKCQLFPRNLFTFYSSNPDASL